MRKDLPAEDRADALLRARARRSGKLYDELRDHYRAALLGTRRARRASARSKIQVLEALLRLRQAACHPGLIDRAAARRAERQARRAPAAARRGRRGRAQGAGLLAVHELPRDRPRRGSTRRGIVYEYLDGQTRDRAARVERFQTDPDCPLFLISLKAGGLGLNLTAADYVFLLDPWWNPAVEAQAIDRAHRIGQTPPGLRLPADRRDTVEEKVLELQETKRELADAIINADKSLIRALTREDLELLLS